MILDQFNMIIVIGVTVVAHFAIYDLFSIYYQKFFNTTIDQSIYQETENKNNVIFDPWQSN